MEGTGMLWRALRFTASWDVNEEFWWESRTLCAAMGEGVGPVSDVAWHRLRQGLAGLQEHSSEVLPPLLPGTCSPCVPWPPKPMPSSGLVYSQRCCRAWPQSSACSCWHSSRPPHLTAKSTSHLIRWVCHRPGARVQSPTWHVPQGSGAGGPQTSPLGALFPECSSWLPRLPAPPCSGFTLGHRVEEKGTVESLPSGTPDTTWGSLALLRINPIHGGRARNLPTCAKIKNLLACPFLSFLYWHSLCLMGLTPW